MSAFTMSLTSVLKFVLCPQPSLALALLESPRRKSTSVGRYLRGYDSVSEACASIGQYLTFYNDRRPHSSLDGKTPDQAYFTPLPLRLAA